MFFTIEVKNLGTATQTGASITLVLKDGLNRPKLITAPVDTVQANCPEPAPASSPSSSPSSPPCTSTWIQPVCHAWARRLTCHYSHYEFAPAGPDANPLSIVVRVLAGSRRREAALASLGPSTPGTDAAKSRARRVIRVAKRTLHR